MTSPLQNKIVLITGASSGIGATCASFLSTQGYTVYGTSRHPDESGNQIRNWQLIPLDVRNDASVDHCINTILSQEGGLDAVINNAGFGIAGSVEETSLKEAKEQFEVNFFGILRIIRRVLPLMRKQGHGTIINISSLGGLIGLPFQALYSASKFALEGLSEGLYKEVRSSGIHIVLIEPGDFKTAFTANRRTTIASEKNSPYGETFARALATMERDETQGCDPQQIAKLAHHILEASNPRLRYRVGAFTQKLSVSLKALLPNRIFDWLIMKHYQLP